jgi:hypothetical protein
MLCMIFMNIFYKLFSYFELKYVLVFMPKIHQNISFQENSQHFRRTMATIARNSSHNISPSLAKWPVRRALQCGHRN